MIHREGDEIRVEGDPRAARREAFAVPVLVAGLAIYLIVGAIPERRGSAVAIGAGLLVVAAIFGLLVSRRRPSVIITPRKIGFQFGPRSSIHWVPREDVSGARVVWTNYGDELYINGHDGRPLTRFLLRNVLEPELEEAFRESGIPFKSRRRWLVPRPPTPGSAAASTPELHETLRSARRLAGLRIALGVTLLAVAVALAVQVNDDQPVLGITDGIPVEARVVEVIGSDRVSSIWVRYTVDGRTFTQGLFVRPEDTYRVEQRITLFVDPHDPTHVGFERKTEPHPALEFFTAAATMVGLFFIFGGVRRLDRVRRQRRILWRFPWEHGRLRLESRSWPRWRARSGLLIDPHHAAYPVRIRPPLPRAQRQGGPSDEVDVEVAGPLPGRVILQPLGSKRLHLARSRDRQYPH